MMQVTKFASFRDYGMKPLDQITAKDIIDYRDCLVEQGELTNAQSLRRPQCRLASGSQSKTFGSWKTVLARAC